MDAGFQQDQPGHVFSLLTLTKAWLQFKNIRDMLLTSSPALSTQFQWKGRRQQMVLPQTLELKCFLISTLDTLENHHLTVNRQRQHHPSHTVFTQTLLEGNSQRWYQTYPQKKCFTPRPCMWHHKQATTILTPSTDSQHNNPKIYVHFPPQLSQIRALGTIRLLQNSFTWNVCFILFPCIKMFFSRLKTLY